MCLTFCSFSASYQSSDVESFQCKPTPLNSTTLEKLRHVLDYRCIVGGGEQIFLLALGVSWMKKCGLCDTENKT